MSSYMNLTDGTEYNITIEELNRQQVLIRLPFTILIALTMTTGLVGNILTIYVYGFRLKLSPTYLFVVMLSCADLIICACVTPARIAQNIYPMMTTWDILCQFHLCLAVFTGLCNYGFLLAIAAERYRKVCQPLKTQITMRAAKIIIACIFIFCATQGIMTLFYYGSVKKPTNYPGIYLYFCSAKDDQNPNYYQLGFFGFYNLLAMVTFTLLIFLYTIILRHMKVMKKTKCVKSQQNRNSATSIPCPDEIQQKWLNIPETVDSNRLPSNLSVEEVELSNTEMSSKVSSDEISKVYTKSIAPIRAKLREVNNEKRAKERADRIKHTTITMMMITVVFIVTFLPSFGAIMINSLMRSLNTTSTTSILYWFARHTFYIASCSNPIIYGYRNPNFIAEIKRMLGVKQK
ncbi:G-protein coupled receptor 22 isoform X2 [Octopus bimaculoides]|uniref:G-protein coupled receptors family 1 profile domain-containing protein n=2 Tax=Octopus bimaculoides TaxID=37653 RepID=A0A0L8HMV5_OCTBM|nr:G-protein coupled receptor 22 isoform X2 [Octopus bimaculoides]|eukprot:XP_014770998.1 PREDICTED: cholecystokinin receptor-like isoform X2 [Octopus bimaculoides]